MSNTDPRINDPRGNLPDCKHDNKKYEVQNDTENWLVEYCLDCGQETGVIKLEQAEMETFFYQVELERQEQDKINKDVKQTMDRLNNLIETLGQQTVAYKWVTSDHVTNTINKWKEEGEE